MKSLHAWIVLALLGTLSLSLVVFIAISNHIQRDHLYPIFEAMDELELEHARGALDRGGVGALGAYLQHLDALFGARHYLLNENGIDVASGTDRSSLLPRRTGETKSRAYRKGQLVITHRSMDRHYWFVAVDASQTDRWTFFPYYLLIVGVTALIYSLAALGVLRPLQRITGALDRFGQGQLSTRVNMNRADEIGDLARSFDGMAERIQILLASERRLLADISHELRSPLARLKFAVRLADDNAVNSSRFERVQREVNRITALVSEITELTRAEGDPSTRAREPVNLRELLEETVADCDFEAGVRGCAISIAGELRGTVKGDRELLRRAFENVLRNAIRYSPEHATIECDVAEEARAATILVRDCGSGVPDNMLAKIFEPFFQVEEARETASGNVGLGLSIAKRALQLHEGTISAENAQPGLRVRIVIPLTT